MTLRIVFLLILLILTGCVAPQSSATPDSMVEADEQTASAPPWSLDRPVH